MITLARLLQEDFLGVLEWACKLDAVQAITLEGITARWQASHGTVEGGSPFVAQLLADCHDRIRAHWGKVGAQGFVVEVCVSDRR
jgi:hypothetical protein